MRNKQQKDNRISFLTKQYSLLLAPGFWERLWNRRHLLTLEQSYLLLLSQEKFFLGDYRTALIRLAECIDTPGGMEKHTANKVCLMASLMESLCELFPWPYQVLYAGVAANRLVAPELERISPSPSYKASVIKRLRQTKTGE